jgi:hypothetical protein
MRQNIRGTGGLNEGINRVSDVERFLNSCDENVTGIRNVREYIKGKDNI